MILNTSESEIKWYGFSDLFIVKQLSERTPTHTKVRKGRTDRHTVCSCRNADDLFKQSPSKIKKYVFNKKKLQHIDYLFLCEVCFTCLFTINIISYPKVIYLCVCYHFDIGKHCRLILEDDFATSHREWWYTGLNNQKFR